VSVRETKAFGDVKPESFYKK